MRDAEDDPLFGIFRRLPDVVNDRRRRLAVGVEPLMAERFAPAHASLAPPDLCRHVVIVNGVVIERVGAPLEAISATIATPGFRSLSRALCDIRA
jgi:hypothetical protein